MMKISKEKRSEYDRRYYEKHCEEVKGRCRKYAKRWRENHPNIKEFDRNRYLKYKNRLNSYGKKYYEEHKGNESFKLKRSKRTLAYYYRNKVKAKARKIARKKIPITGKLCSCGLPATERHHQNYKNPLDVIFLCKKCHENIHHQCLSEITAILKEEK